MAVAAGLIVYLGTSGAIDWGALHGLGSAWPLTLAAVALLAADALAIAWRLALLVNAHGLRLAFGASVRLTFIGLFFNACLPGATGGDAVKIYYAAAGNRGRMTELTTLVLLDRAVGMFGLLVAPLLVAPLFPGLVARVVTLQVLLGLAGAAAVAMVAAAAVGTSPALAPGTRWQRWLASSWAGRVAAGALATLRGFRGRPGVLAGALALSLITHAMAVAAILLLVLATHAGDFAWPMALLIPLGLVANALPLTPGGLGVGEAAFERLFALVGASSGADSLLAWRVLTALISLLGVVFYASGRRRLVHAPARLPASEAPSR